MTVVEVIAVFVAGIAAGAINAVVGSGTLVTFPALLAVGFSPVVANVSNCIGLVPGSVAGAIGYRHELKGQGARAKRLIPASALGGIIGAIALVVLPDEAFDAVVPGFIALALVLIVLQPWLQKKVAGRRPTGVEHGLALWVLVFVLGIYGGYFGAAQGILLMAVMGVAINESLQRLNGLKNVLAGLVNLIAGVMFMFIADPAWDAVALIAVGSLIGGTLGARYGRRLPSTVLRGLIVAVGLFAITRLLFFG